MKRRYDALSALTEQIETVAAERERELFPARDHRIPLPEALVLPMGCADGIGALEKSLVALGFDVSLIARKGKTWQQEAVRHIRDHKPRLCVTCQKFYPGHGRVVQDACRYVGTRTLFIDYGLWPHYGSVFFDGEGTNATSSIAGHLDREVRRVPIPAFVKASQKVDAMIQELQQRAEAADAEKERLGLEGLPESFTFLALQRSGEMNLRCDAHKSRQDMNRVLWDTVDAAKRAKQFVVAKTHPVDKKVDLTGKALEGKHYRIVGKQEHIADNDHVFFWLLKHCGHLITVNSSTAHLAMALGKPVSCMGRGWFSGNRVVAEVYKVRDALKTPKVDKARVRTFLNLLASRQLTMDECGQPQAVQALLEMLFPDITQEQGG